MAQAWREFAKQQNEKLGIHESEKPAPTPKHKPEPTKPLEAAINTFQSVTTRRGHTVGEMNGLEKRYAAHLDLRKIVGEIKDWRFESIKFRLAPATFYTVDFLVWMADSTIEVHEVKGHWEDDARVKIKVAPQMFPMFKFVSVHEHNRKKNDWRFEEFR